MGALLSGRMNAAYGYTILPADETAKIKRVTFSEVAEGDRLTIRDRNGIILYAERIRKDGDFAKRFDLSELPENQYAFELDKGEEITVLPFRVGEEEVTVKQEMRTDIRKPRLSTHADQVILTRDVDDTQTLKIEIFHEGRSVYSEEVSKVGKMARQYDFSTSLKGEYLFQIQYDDRLYTEYVKVR